MRAGEKGGEFLFLPKKKKRRALSLVTLCTVLSLFLSSPLTVITEVTGEL